MPLNRSYSLPSNPFTSQNTLNKGLWKIIMCVSFILETSERVLRRDSGKRNIEAGRLDQDKSLVSVPDMSFHSV